MSTPAEISFGASGGMTPTGQQGMTPTGQQRFNITSIVEACTVSVRERKIMW